ncbi:MAG TPA: ankyrin repeat domain-containing protein [Candidatus Saccharimonadales bacterium]|nr:ankyrin repeat domain-containing protein [Candidatus Saccharimonadales bacterium]
MKKLLFFLLCILCNFALSMLEKDIKQNPLEQYYQDGQKYFKIAELLEKQSLNEIHQSFQDYSKQGCIIGVEKILTSIFFEKNSKKMNVGLAAFNAVAHKHEDVADKLLNKMHEIPQDYLTLIFIESARHNLIQIIQKLLHNGIDPNQTNDTGTSPLFMACYRGNIETVKLLLSHDTINPNQRFNLHQPLKNEASFFSLESFQQLKKMVTLFLFSSQDKINVNSATIDGVTPLLTASANGYIEIVELLLSHDKIDPNQSTYSGITPLIAACNIGNIEIVKLLLSHPKIDPNRADEAEMTPLLRASKNGFMDILKLLLSHPNINPNQNNKGIPTLVASIFIENIEVVKLLLSHENTNPNETTDDGISPLSMACHTGNTEMVKLLLSHPKIDPNEALNDYGTTPLLIACANGKIEVVKLLLSHDKIDLNKANNYRMTPFSVAFSNGHAEIIKLLLSHPKIDVKNVTYHGEILLTTALSKGHNKIVSLMHSFNMQIMLKQYVTTLSKDAHRILDAYEKFLKANFQELHDIVFIEMHQNQNFKPLRDIFKLGSIPALLLSLTENDDEYEIARNLFNNIMDDKKIEAPDDERCVICLAENKEIKENNHNLLRLECCCCKICTECFFNTYTLRADITSCIHCQNEIRN